MTHYLALSAFFAYTEFLHTITGGDHAYWY